MTYLCIDPGPIYSGVAIFQNDKIVYADKIKSLDALKLQDCNIVLIEKVESRGSILGNTTIDTAIMCGRFKQEFLNRKCNVVFIERRQVLSTLKCKRDGDVIKVLRPLVKGFKLTKDAWQAAALYFTYNHE